MALFHDEDAGEATFTVRPNCALGWRWTKRLILLFACCLIGVASYFASLGAWLVLPFAGLELAVLAAGFYLSSLAGSTREVVEIRGSEVRVLRGNRRLQEVAVMSAPWTRVAMVRDPRGWHPSRLFLRSHGRSVELTTRLVESEREDLAALLEARLGGGSAALTRAASGPRACAGYREREAHAMSRTGFPRDGE
jgi:uncharacterized membrane protein